MVSLDLLSAEICWRVLGTRANFNGFCVLAALLHGTLVMGVSQTLRRWTEGVTYIRHGGHHIGHWPTFLVWHKTASPPQMDDSIVFARWCQCALSCGQIGATWRIRLNSCFLRFTRVHNTNGKSIGAVVSAQLTAEIPILYTGRPFPSKLPLIMRGIWTHQIHNSLGQSEPKIQTESWPVQLFSFRWPPSVPIFYNGRPFHLKINCPFPRENMDPHLTCGSLGPYKSSTQAASRWVQPLLHGWLV